MFLANVGKSVAEIGVEPRMMSRKVSDVAIPCFMPPVHAIANILRDERARIVPALEPMKKRPRLMHPNAVKCTARSDVGHGEEELDIPEEFLYELYNQTKNEDRMENPE